VPELPTQEADHSAESEVEPLEQEEIEFGR
jgi:hypothetical protein